MPRGVSARLSRLAIPCWEPWRARSAAWRARKPEAAGLKPVLTPAQKQQRETDPPRSQLTALRTQLVTRWGADRRIETFERLYGGEWKRDCMAKSRGHERMNGERGEHNSRFQDLTGQQFRSWHVGEFYGTVSEKDKHSVFICQCRCGMLQKVLGRSLNTKRSRQCEWCRRALCASGAFQR